MQKEVKKSPCHPEALAEGSYEILHYVQNDRPVQSGRTLVEMLATVAVMGLLAMGAIKGYHFIVNKIKAQNTAKMIKTLALERQNSAINIQTGSERTVKGPHSGLVIKNGTAGNHEPYFWVETSLSDSDFCEALKESNLIQAEFIEVDNVRDGTCTDNSKIAFYFKKDKGGLAYCPDHATNCDQYGDATACEEGYYLEGGVCSRCPEHVATCTDEFTPTSCESGYLLYNGFCIDQNVTICTVDSDCDVCATCDNGFCTNECEIPSPDEYNDCGENECIVYDEDTQTCKYACTKVEYLESTGSQYIDTGISTSEGICTEAKFKINTITRSNQAVFGKVGVTSGSTTRYFFGIQSSSSDLFYYAFNDIYQTNKQQDTNIHTVLFDSVNNILKIDNNSWTLSGDLRTNSETIYLFGAHFGGDNNNPMSGRIYYTKIYDNNTLIRDFIPVLAPNNRPAMFDRVSQKLYYNQGSGEFLTD